LTPRLAYVLCAGDGRRLIPLTRRLPKALLPVSGRPMVFRLLDALGAGGVGRVLINLHSHPRILRKALASYGRRRRLAFTFFHEPVLLDTGGALRNARAFLTEPFWLVNCDFLPDGFSFAAMDRAHRRCGSLATLAVRPMRRGEPFNPVGLDRRGRVVRVSGVYGRGGRDHVFLGVHRIDPEALEYLSREKIFSVFGGFYANLARAGLPIQGYRCRPAVEADLGTLEGYYAANFSGV